jgi:hypothetical protein
VGATLYFSALGDDAADGSLATPKRQPANVNVNTLPAGSALRLRAGDTFNFPATWRFINPANTATNPLVVESYGTGTKPVLQWATGVGNGIEFGANFSDMSVHGGYVFSGLRIVGDGVTDGFGVWTKGFVSDVTIQDCDITAWYTAVNAQGGHNSTRINLLRNKTEGCRGMGFMGCFYSSIFDGNDFSDVNQAASNFIHRVYLRGGDNNRVINNRFVTTQPAVGGTLTFHGLVENGLEISGNVLEYGPGGDPGAWVISLIPDTGAAQGGFMGLQVRNNTVQNAGNNAIHIEASPGAIIDSNIIRLTAVGNQQAIAYADDPGRPQDLKGPGTMTNNTAYGPTGSNMSFSAPAGSVDTGNTAIYS